MKFDYFYADLGNRKCKSLDAIDNLKVIPSCALALDPHDEVTGTDASPIILTIDPDGTPRRYLVGEKAQARKGIENLHSDKIDRAGLFLSAVLPECKTIEINTLVLAVPDARNREHRDKLQSLVGDRYYARNGVDIHLRIGGIKLVSESIAAYNYCRNLGLFNDSADRANGIYNIGGRDFAAFLFDPSGDPLSSYTTIDNDCSTLGLANAISAREKPRTATSLDPVEIMNAIENRSYTTRAGWDFSHSFAQCKTTWIDRLCGIIRAKWGAKAEEIGRIAIVGGSAPLLFDYAQSKKGRFPIVPDPTAAVVRGLKYAR